ncbi:uncharacterized protein BHQ10_006373 [Talaromyces amestolkiae]|uniref:F-box domain-containing protein n=1 Tax=Talaromyces amestolkiae TaxID=1196081 RepID=A0A364L3R4_TALAM|nr:uncharacterized protein BHQ10_006373 [Talaromyces amestolkiae]RAO70361.1 hypothetical protein BHQ10_006373 [Talaromyces amestolkiae]
MATSPSSKHERDHWDNLDLLDKTLIFKTGNGPLYYDPRQFEYIFFMSSIKKVKLMIPEPKNEWFSRRYNNQPESYSKLTHLCLQESELTPSSLSHLLRLTPSLRELKYDHLININQGGESMRYFQCADMDTALQPVLPCLERLCINVDFFTAEAVDLGWGYYWGIRGTLTCLAKCSCLAYLEIPIVLLLGWTPLTIGGDNQLAAVLPLSLRHLTLTTAFEIFECNEWTRTRLYRCVGDYVQTITASASLHVPKYLEKITLKCYHTGLDPDHELVLSRLKDICVEGDIGLDIREYKL